MSPAARALGAVALLALALAAPLNGLRADQTRQLGRFSLGGFDGILQIESSERELTVTIGIDRPLARAIPTRDLQAWVLLENGTSARQLRRFPEAGQEARMSFSGGGDRVIVTFVFERVPALAVALRIGEGYQVFAMPPPAAG